MATRLLVLARPDRIVSINGAANKPIKNFLPRVGRRDLAVAKNYGRLLDELYQQPWFDVDEPEDEIERTLWSMRAALLDSFVYSP